MFPGHSVRSERVDSMTVADHQEAAAHAVGCCPDLLSRLRVGRHREHRAGPWAPPPITTPDERSPWSARAGSPNLRAGPAAGHVRLYVVLGALSWTSNSACTSGSTRTTDACV
ncbi:hypothetical protein GCM10009767_16090 [Kocuria aegyptia]|uniref:Uncharacterized protein n=1 Tax=Kocuria aegyptia TaxID=330943 RepID=A0ABP4WLJ5_9MICC